MLLETVGSGKHRIGCCEEPWGALCPASFRWDDDDNEIKRIFVLNILITNTNRFFKCLDKKFVQYWHEKKLNK